MAYKWTTWMLGLCLLPAWGWTQTSQRNHLEHIDFKLNEHQSAVVEIEFTHSHILHHIKRVKSGLSVLLPKTHILTKQLKYYDVSEFQSLVRGIESFQEGRGTRIELYIDKNYQVQTSTLGKTLIITLRPSLENKHLLQKESDRKISLNFQNIPVKNALQLLAKYHRMNLIMSDSVEGNVTLNLEDVPWSRAINMILQAKGLGKYIEGNVVLVAPLEELNQRQPLFQQKHQQQSGTLDVEIIPIKFAKASEIAAVLKGSESAGMLSEHATISVDERTNSLLIREWPHNMTSIYSIIESLDIPVKQVQIEARIVSINEGNLDELGIRWGVSHQHGRYRVGGSIEHNVSDLNVYQGNDDQGGGSKKSLADFLNVNLASTHPNAASIAFQVAKLGSHTLLDLELSALQQESKAEIISSPRLMTTNKRPAYIEQGTEIPYLEAASSGATSVTFRKAVLSLKVTPQITPDNRLVLDLSVTQDRPGQVVKTGTGEAVAINTQRIGTQVLVNNGDTIVLGGIFQHNITNTVDKVPLLGDLPLLGALFRRTYANVGKSELLIFITPKVVFPSSLR